MLLVLFKRFFGKHSPALAPTGEKDERHTPEEMVELIRSGKASRDDFIQAYKPYIAKVTSRFCKRYIDPSRDDEFSIALSAFNEAIEQYASHAGKSFLGFAETVIRRRLIDYVRKEQRHAGTVPYSSFDRTDDEELTVNPIETQEAVNRYQIMQEQDARRNEIVEYDIHLKQYGISFSDLQEISPKHTDSRLLLIGISRLFIEAEGLFEAFEVKQKLPVKELCEMASVSRKTIERNRKYIIALAILHNGNYPYLQYYLEPQTDSHKVDKQAKGGRS
ncbi:RNA polymerase sigma factor SigI [Paenibacillus baekrokdamisoli]|uniref:RNA polymerase sigma factor SigI n=1 Tax=Paenibacillus baekrokdamisoli TaxID=1712516 RepID=A0A3G9J0W5_9BACL|nr:RNA polymerase sigma factor SigI [Paenibacillus baekrokdamisoli]BBH24837.1 RNA polymerase sigma factor SigI [Paenibacillus baekrokdamisoli]